MCMCLCAWEWLDCLLELCILIIWLQAGCSANLQNSVGDTPLHTACEEGSREVVKLLMQSRASVDARNKDDKTPLDLADPALCHYITHVLS